MYLLLFAIVLYRTIVTVYTDNIFVYNYLRQMHQIIHLSPVGCFTPARGKSMQKNRGLSRVKVCIGSRAPHCRTVLQNGQDKTPKASPKKQSIMEYLPGLPQVTKPLRRCSGNRAKMLLKSHLFVNKRRIHKF